MTGAPEGANLSTPPGPVAELRAQLEATEREEFRRALRALLMRPLLTPEDAVFPLVRRQAAALRDWFAREAGWSLHVDRAHARLRKTPARLTDTTRAARARAGDAPFSRRRYVLLCLALAALDAEERQIALGRLAHRVVSSVAADEHLQASGVRFTLETRDERRDLVAVARLLIALHVLRRVDGDEADYVAGSGDALYTIDRSALAALLATRRPPSSVRITDLDGRIAALLEETVPDTPDARNRALRQHLIRRLLDDALLAYDELDDDTRAYLTSQRARILSVVTEATGLTAEVRAEGIALLDDRGDATDLALPEEGTDGHLTLLLAEHLAAALRADGARPVPLADLAAFTAELATRHAAHWRKDVADPANAAAHTEEAMTRLAALDLVALTPQGVIPRPAIARYAVDEPVLPEARAGAPQLFDPQTR